MALLRFVWVDIYSALLIILATNARIKA